MYSGYQPYEDLNDAEFAEYLVSKFYYQIFDLEEAEKEDNQFEERKKVCLETGRRYRKRRYRYHERCLDIAKDCAKEAIVVFVTDWRRGSAIREKIRRVEEPIKVPDYSDKDIHYPMSKPRVAHKYHPWPPKNKQAAIHELGLLVEAIGFVLAKSGMIDPSRQYFGYSSDRTQSYRDTYRKNEELIARLKNVFKVSEKSPIYIQQCHDLEETVKRQDGKGVNIERPLLLGYLGIVKEFEIAEGLKPQTERVQPSTGT